MRTICALTLSIALSTAASGAYTTVAAPDVGETNCAHIDILDAHLPGGGSWAPYGTHSFFNSGYNNGNGLYAIRIDDDLDKTWSDGRYTLIAAGGCSTYSVNNVGYDDNNGSGYVQLCSGNKTDLQCEVNFPGDGFVWCIKPDATVLASDDATDSMVTYAISESSSGSDAVHWIVFWEEGAGGGDFNDAVFEIYQIAPYLRGGADATGIATLFLKYSQYRSGMYQTDIESAAYMSSHYDILWWAGAVAVDNADLYDHLLATSSVPSLHAYASLRSVRDTSASSIPSFLNDAVDPDLSTFDQTSGDYVPDRATWLLTKDGEIATDLNDPDLINVARHDRYALDWGIADCREWVIDRIVDEVVEGLGMREYDGFSADNTSISAFLPKAYSAGNPNTWNWKYKNNESQWQRHAVTLLHDLRDALHAHGRYLAPNVDLHYYDDVNYSYRPQADTNAASDNWAWDQLLYGDDGRPIVDLIATEQPLKGKKKGFDKHYILGTDWERAMLRHEEVIDAGVVNLWYVYPVLVDKSWRDRAFLYHYASHLLIAKPQFSLFHATVNSPSVTNVNPPWYNEYDIDLGAATGSRQTHPNGYGYRFYENGVAVVNPTTDPVTVSLTDTEPNPDVVYPTVTLSSGRGIILLPDNVTNINTGVGYDTIQAAVNAAADNDCIMVSPGTYAENVDLTGLTVTNLTLRSLSPLDPNIVAATIIDGSMTGAALTFEGDEAAFDMQEWTGSRISGLTLLANHAGAAVDGNGTAATLEHCVIKNTAGDGCDNFDGGIVQCTVNDNGDDGLVNCDGSIRYCEIDSNAGHGVFGGASPGTISNCYIRSNGDSGVSGYQGDITNCLITKNEAVSKGGGLFDCDGTIASCTIADNTAADAGGGGGLYGCNGTIVNCIIWDNKASGVTNDVGLSVPPSSPTYSCFNEGTTGTGNINSNPLFDANYDLTEPSPCIDAGDSNNVVGLEDESFTTGESDGDITSTGTFIIDLAGNPRVYHIDVDSPLPDEVIDMGAFEVQGEAEYAQDCDGDGIPDDDEVDRDEDGTPDECQTFTDCNDNGVPDKADLDLDGNEVADACEIANDPSLDANGNGVIDVYETVLYVDSSVVGGHDNGTSWVHAYSDLQDALSYAASHDHVDEIWVAAGTYTPALNTSFGLTTGVGLYAGFAGNELARDERDVSTNVTTLSGDGTGKSVVLVSNCNNVVVDGFTIRDAKYAGKGGGVLITASSHVDLLNCAITDNATEDLVIQAYAGGVYVTGGSSDVAIEDCVFRSNSTDGAGTNYGGAMAVAGTSSATVSRCIFSDNQGDAGGALWVALGSNVMCTDSLFAWNNAIWGGAILASGDLTLASCTISDNAADVGGNYGGIWQSVSALTVVNSIVYDNGGSANDSIYLSAGGTATVSYSNVEGGWTGCGNINVDPAFNDPDGADNTGGTADDDYTLNAATPSPCIDVGDNNSVVSGTDLAGNPRIVVTVDMGAYEDQSTSVTVLRVDASVVGGAGDGSSWADAYSDLQDALGYAASQGDVDEIWVAAGTYTPDVNTSFDLSTGVGLYGGFAGDELTRDERNASTNVTTLSGSGINDTVVSISNCNNVAVDGFTIRDASHVGKGGGVFVYASCNVDLVNCTIEGNTTGERAAGVYVTGNSSATIIVDCIFRSNSTPTAYLTYGGALAVADTSSATVSRCIFSGNQAFAGGALWVEAGSDVACNDSLFAWNDATWGGAIYASGDLTLASCTIADNAASGNYGGVSQDANTLTMVNSIVYDNGGGANDSIYISGSATATVSYSNVEGGWTGAGTENINADPDFKDPDGADNIGGTADDDYTLDDGVPPSPCIDVGDNNSVVPGTDLAGNTRVVNIVDMGAYEDQL
ncbi:MAG: right-handed parallel beta-helix repeat-containing protein [Phycisphaerales bacterium]|nr:right-handed parallel beta-helix repeat-containing protein [Phycisphaerales bacterium]